ncbi:MAG: hypothetical protein M3Z95_03580 [Actinomycetota bacterium]|nr:hypothetical protein [Actinomycetota bacterium]
MRKATVAWAALVAMVGCLAGAANASASSIAVTATPNPALRGATVTLNNTGSTNPETPSAINLIYDYYEPNVAPCATTAANARDRSHGSGFITTLEIGPDPSFSFSRETTFVPVAGANTYRICAYLYSGGADSAPPDAMGTTLLSIPPTRAELLAQAIKKCHKTKSRARRAKCVAAAKKRYAPKK